jgi:hypothetical protein
MYFTVYFNFKNYKVNPVKMCNIMTSYELFVFTLNLHKNRKNTIIK